MSSLARRTLRTTAAAAGIAALGVGLAGNAVAAPAGDVEAPAPASTSPLQGLPSAAPLAGLPSNAAVPNLADLPMLFVFEGPTVRTAQPSDTPRPVSDRAADRSVVETNESTPADVEAPTQVGALSALDSAGLFAGLVPERPVD